MPRLVEQRDKKNCDASGASRSLTHAEVGVMFGISRGRVFQIEQAAIEKIRRAIRNEAAAEGKTIREWLFG